MPLPLYLLALAVFAMGTSEFVLAGLLPDLAADLDQPLAAVGLATPAFAIGMVVGAPLTAALARRWPPRRSLLGFVLVFAAAHVAGALVADLRLLLATRVVAALANAGFLAVALTTATTLVPPERRGRALAVLLSGTTLATVIGVPAGALVGTLLGWRATFWAIALLCLPAALGVAWGLPRPAAPPHPAGTPGAAADAGASAAGSGQAVPLRAELAALRSPVLVRTLVLAALANAATFAGFTFLAPVVVGPAGLGELWVPVALALFGVGAFAGVTIAGRVVDRAAVGPLTVRVSVAAWVALAVPIGWAALAVVAEQATTGAWRVLLLVLVVVLGALSFGVGTSLVAGVLGAAAAGPRPAPTMGGSYATAALNVGAVVGPLAASGALSAVGGDATTAALVPLWTSAGLGLVVVVAVVAGRSRHAAGTPEPGSAPGPGPGHDASARARGAD
ncbi:MFS transporter [Nocardioides sp. WV_118_6]|uniref:MFS transporter n=1 Tax=Nocardioides simplex TaxID=2045 RepID=UPI00215012FD|nr:MFS transporter [Pimelobacter simplex]UUW89536.1 MFS transporter [Pimelobacter simplex]UUW93365.1 MFS transporter [Pimelobacter simplex]